MLRVFTQSGSGTDVSAYAQSSLLLSAKRSFPEIRALMTVVASKADVMMGGPNRLFLAEAVEELFLGGQGAISESKQLSSRIIVAL